MNKDLIITDSRFNQPQWNAKLWRYMSIEKFFDLIINKHIYFTNLDKMSDKNEAEIPRKNSEELRKSYLEKSIDEKEAERNFNRYYIGILSRKKSTFVNCWIMSQDESYALWKIYLGGEKLGVALKTNTKRLLKSINSENVYETDHMYFSKVEYADYLKGDINIAKLTVTKRLPYKYENEARLIVMKEPEFKQYNNEQVISNGIRYKINIEELIEEIYISPFGGLLFKSTFNEMLDKIYPALVPRIKFSRIRDN